MPNRLHRYYGAGYSHFITTSCYQRWPLLGSARDRGLFLMVLEQVRQRYRFIVAGQKNLLMPAAGMPTLRTPRSVGEPIS
ncbi:MAG: hypothetical protein WCF26_14365 [Candidatus Sulfotelmatobacter sp.]